ncbi:MAG: uroporphyrinogen-III C-methyltransferase [Acidimicrobiales bacterium]
MTVFLVGAGPGDPGLLTLRGAELLGSADAVVHDRLVDHRVLALAPTGASRYDVGKRPGGSVNQEEINQLLVALGRQHQSVVRLKGGDPYVFGRGGEEALALSAAGIAFEVVPGVSSVNGVLAYAGIPVTHRGLATSYSVVTGHLAGSSGGNGSIPVDWGALARVGGTIVVLMGVARRGEIADRLIAGGRSPATPAAVIERGTGSHQRTIRTTLGGLSATDPSTPAIIVIGEVASLDLAWFERKALLGWRVIVTRSREQASTLAVRLAEAGAEPIEVPTIEIADPSDAGLGLKQALVSLAHFDWVAFTSANSVRRVFAILRDARELAGPKVAAVGKATASALLEHGVVADLISPVALSEELAAAFGAAPAEGSRVLVPQAAGARDALSSGLASLGYEVEVVEAYRTVRPTTGGLEQAAIQADAITFSSSSTVEGFLSCYGRDHLPPVVVTIGPITTRTAEENGIHVDAEATESSVEGLVSALERVARGLRPSG